MSEVMALRTQIIDNLKALDYPNLNDRYFLLLWDGQREYTVFLDHPQYTMRYNFHSDEYHGEGPTPEEAYDNMLKKTALYLYVRYHQRDLFEE
ncbi:hypothetical protein KCU65_g3277, partial [Aureobasidium melanogenum]